MAVIKKIKTVFQLRRGTTAEWETNKEIIPAAGEPCFDLDLGTLKIGDGVTNYENLKVLGDVEIQTIVEQNTAIVTELQTTVDQKADAEDVEAVKTDLQAYIDEQIKLVESGTMDDGEI